MKKQLQVAAVTMGILLLTGFSPKIAKVSASEDSGKIQVEDFRGKRLVLEAPVRRIVCLLDSALTGIYMLGAEQKVVGVSLSTYTGSSAPYYAEMDPRIKNKTLPVVSNAGSGSVERIIALKPDMVIVFSLNKELIAALEERGIPVYGVFIRKVPDIYREVTDLGRLTGTAARAEQLVDYTKERIARIHEKISGILPANQPDAYFMWAKGVLDSGGQQSIVQELLQLSGASNVCGHIDREHVVISMEHLLSVDPEVIIMWYNAQYNPEDIAAKPAWKVLSASKHQRIHEIPDLFSCDLWTLNFQYSALLMAAWCHPGLFSEEEIAREAGGIFSMLYGSRIPGNPAAFSSGKLGQ